MTTKNQQKLIKAAKSFDSKIHKALNRAIMGQRVSGELRHLMLDDAYDLRRFCEAIIKRQFKRAATMQDYGMDTMVREMIPLQIYERLANLDD